MLSIVANNNPVITKSLFFFYSRNAITSRLSSRWNQHCRLQHKRIITWKRA